MHVPVVPPIDLAPLAQLRLERPRRRVAALPLIRAVAFLGTGAAAWRIAMPLVLLRRRRARAAIGARVTAAGVAGTLGLGLVRLRISWLRRARARALEIRAIQLGDYE